MQSSLLGFDFTPLPYAQVDWLILLTTKSKILWILFATDPGYFGVGERPEPKGLWIMSDLDSEYFRSCYIHEPHNYLISKQYLELNSYAYYYNPEYYPRNHINRLHTQSISTVIYTVSWWHSCLRYPCWSCISFFCHGSWTLCPLDPTQNRWRSIFLENNTFVIAYMIRTHPLLFWSEL